MEANRSRATSAAKDPQVPIDSKILTWVEVRVATEYIAYVLIAASDAAATALNTNKGIYTVDPGKELWYSATQSVGAVSSAESLTWAVLKVAPDTDAGRIAIVGAINASDGLASSGRSAVPALVGPSGPVTWPGTSLPNDVTTFEWLSDSGYTWNLSLAQSSSTLTTVVWSTDDGSNTPATNPTALPNKFGTDGAEVAMTKAAKPTFDYVFDDYS